MRTLRLLTLALAASMAACSLELPKELIDALKNQPPAVEQDPSIQGLRLVMEAVGAAQEFGVRPAPQPPTAPPPAPALAPGMATGPTPPISPLFCDAKPALTHLTICGNTKVINHAKVAWSSCTPPPPPGQQTSDMTTSGILEMHMDLEAVCGAVTDVTYTRNTAFSITRKTSKGESTTHGHVRAAGTQALITDAFTRTYQLDVTGTGMPQPGTAPTPASAPTEQRLHGEITVDFQGGKDVKPTSTFTGTLQAGPGSLEFRTLKTGGECRWPTAGEIIRSDDKGTHAMAFGPECGKAMLDGKPVELEPKQQQPPPQ